MQYRRAPEIEEVAEELIEGHHSMLRNHAPRIVYVMTKTPNNPDAGKDYRIRKVTGVNAFLAATYRPSGLLPEEYGYAVPDLVAIEVKERYWLSLKAAQQQGLVDHLLTHLTYDLEKDSWTIEGPEFGEFPEVLERHGFWKPGTRMKSFAAVVSEQLSLLPDHDDEDEEEADEADEEDEEEIGQDRPLRESVERLRPDPGDGIESVTISSGDRSMTLSGGRS